ncbi:Scr1 family TA system antitoxin-like transcriptional regulator [Streptomyces sp. MST-110588]|uniref:Scr1 family TA system antitoxin-like transcriptional regulator n=1 Tax=Streptomyces sp. MST-110588 TaxID=2833628 RepID=UPI001F5C1C65|nr:Scr1 family TA system antitoxin-like transcriptional regulator [Streptomyces sp. MST-110588]UNO40371.1 helix-turn-helix domain-containing protein [Streptomyces sp. MST-110588]
MPPRAAPTARQQRLGAELRKMREHAGLNVGEAGQELGADRTRISNIEAGRVGVSAERVRALAAIYSCDDAAYVDALAAMAVERGTGWWAEYRGVLSTSALDIAELEHHARSLTVVQVVFIPGLLQTEEYARALFSRAVPELSATEIARRVSYRMRRKCVMERKEPTDCTFIIHECALRMLHADQEGQKRQLQRLLDVSEQDGVTLRVIPFSAGGFPGAHSSMTYATGPVRKLDTVSLDTPHGSMMLDAETHLENYRRITQRIMKVASDPRASQDFIRAIAKQL